MSQRFKKLGAILVAAGIVLGMVTWLLLTFVLIRPVSYRPTVDVGPVVLRSWPEHDAIYQASDFPYRMEIDCGQGKLLYLGCRHASEATDPQLAELERLWSEFRPTVAFCEGRERMNRFASRPNAGPFSESKLVRILAYRSGTNLYTLEPSYEDEVASLLQKHNAPLVATYLTLRVYTAEAKGYQGNCDDLALTLLRKRIDVVGLRDTFDSLGSFDKYWKEQFADSPDWRTLPDTETIEELVEVGNTSRQARGEHMVQSLTELVRRGERVFAVVGASHVIRQEPYLRQTLKAEPGSLGAGSPGPR
jgi:hypothetical protein